MKGLSTTMNTMSSDLQSQTRLPEYRLAREQPLHTHQRIATVHSLQNRYTIKIALILSTLGEIGLAQNILRMAPAFQTSTVCHPCLYYIPARNQLQNYSQQYMDTDTSHPTNTGTLRMRHSGPDWTSDLEVHIPISTLATAIFVDMSLIDRTQRLRIYHGTSEQNANLAGSVHHVHTKAYDSAATHHLYTAASTHNEERAFGFFDLSTLQITHTLMNSALAAFIVTPYSNIPLSNKITYNLTTTHSLLEDAMHLPAYSSIYTSPTILDTRGPREGVGSVCFDGNSALIHNNNNVYYDSFVLDGLLNTGITTCLWFNETGTFDFFHPSWQHYFTLIDGTGRLRIHSHSFRKEVAFNAHGNPLADDVRFSLSLPFTLSANAPWTHVCTISEINKPTRIFINATQVTNDEYETEPPTLLNATPSQYPIGIGGSSDPSTEHATNQGVLLCVSDILIWGRALHASEISKVYQNYMSALWSM